MFGGKGMSEELHILNFDGNKHAVIEPDHDHEPFKFHDKLLYAFVPRDEIDIFLSKLPHKVLGSFDSVSFQPDIYKIEINSEKLTLCQAPLGAPVAVKLLEWLVSVNIFAVA